MKKRNVLRLARAVERGDMVARGIGFNMEQWVARTNKRTRPDHVDSCGTVACLAGWAYCLAHPETDKKKLHEVFNTDSQEISNTAREFLGLGTWQASDLFAPYVIGNWSKITAAQAVKVLRHLAETCRVDWSIIDAEHSE